MLPYPGGYRGARFAMQPRDHTLDHTTVLKYEAYLSMRTAMGSGVRCVCDVSSCQT